MPLELIIIEYSGCGSEDIAVSGVRLRANNDSNVGSVERSPKD